MGLNSRFDRMLERVNLTLQDFQAPSTIVSSRHGRARAPSAGSSSVSSGYDVPKTPVDAYNRLEEGRLGHTFSVIKMKSASGGKIGRYDWAGEGYDGGSDMQFEESDQVGTFRKPFSSCVTLIAHPDRSCNSSQRTSTGLAFYYILNT
jgi:hypothetical protein